MKKAKLIYVFAGPNGSGKSTVVNSYRKNKGFPRLFICPDLIVPSDKKSDKNEYIKAMQKAEEARFNAVQNGESFAFETVLSNPDKLDFIKFSKTKGYKVITIYIVTSSPKINIERIKDRVARGGHDVPTDKIISRYHRSLDLMFDVIALSDNAMVYDNSDKEPALIFAKNHDAIHLLFDEHEYVAMQEPHWSDKYLKDKAAKTDNGTMLILL